jgi:hypothetical protein
MNTVRETIEEALIEARILECARDVYDEEHVLFVAQKLSGCPFGFVKEVFEDQKPKPVNF